MNPGDFHSWWTVAVLVIFVGIVVWAWSGRRQEEFARAARIPLDDDQPVAAEDSRHAATEDKRNG